MRARINIVICTIAAITLACSCNNKSKRLPDTPTRGVAEIAVDDNFAPLIKQLIDVFEGTYKEASIVPVYTSESEAINLLLKDSVRLIVISSKLTKEQKSYIESNNKLFPKEVKIATDAIALIVNKNNPDTLLTVAEIRKIMTGEVTDWNALRKSSTLGKIKLVFDNDQSSTVRYAIDSICGGKALYKGAFAQGNNTKVIDYVSSDVNAIGVIGVDWVGNDSDTTNLTFNDRVSVVAVSNEKIATKANSYKPFQAYMALQYYPLLRDINIILTDPKTGVETGFTTFISRDRGQRLILRAGIVPATQTLRVVNVRNNL